MDLNKFTIRSQQAIQQAQTIASGYGQQVLENGHFLKGILEVDTDVTPFLLKKLNVNLSSLQQALDRIVQGYPKVTGGQITLGRSAQDALTKALAQCQSSVMNSRVWNICFWAYCKLAIP